MKLHQTIYKKLYIEREGERGREREIVGERGRERDREGERDRERDTQAKCT